MESTRYLDWKMVKISFWSLWGSRYVCQWCILIILQRISNMRLTHFRLIALVCDSQRVSYFIYLLICLILRHLMMTHWGTTHTNVSVVTLVDDDCIPSWKSLVPLIDVIIHLYSRLCLRNRKPDEDSLVRRMWLLDGLFIC